MILKLDTLRTKSLTILFLNLSPVCPPTLWKSSNTLLEYSFNMVKNWIIHQYKRESVCVCMFEFICRLVCVMLEGLVQAVEVKPKVQSEQ